MSLFEVNAYLNGNNCFKCGKQGHMGKECHAPKKQWADTKIAERGIAQCVFGGQDHRDSNDLRGYAKCLDYIRLDDFIRSRDL